MAWAMHHAVCIVEYLDDLALHKLAAVLTFGCIKHLIVV